MNFKFKIALAPVIAWLCGLFFFAQPARAQNPVTYSFTGSVTSLNQASSIFAGVGVGTPVQGQLTLDYGAIDTEPGPGFGSYPSVDVGFSGLIGGHAFASASAPFNTVTVSDGAPGDFMTFIVQPGTPDGLNQLQITLFDPAGQAISGDALPNSAAALDAFPDLVLFARSSSGFGQYVCDVTITPVPEPSAITLFAIAGVALAAWRSRKYY